MVTDTDLYGAEQDEIEGWSPVHAWRALGQLKAEEAVEPLLQAYERFGEQDSGWWEWFSDELPDVFLMIGESAISGIRRYLSHRERSKEAAFSQFTAIEGLERIAKANPDLNASRFVSRNSDMLPSIVQMSMDFWRGCWHLSKWWTQPASLSKLLHVDM
jgi:hypothetical protein